MDQLVLDFDFDASDDDLVRKIAGQEIDHGCFHNWDYAYELTWSWFEDQLAAEKGSAKC